MKTKDYQAVREWIQKKSSRLLIFKLFYYILPIIVFITYASVIVFLIIQRDERIYKVIIVPGVIFVAVSIFRKIINAPRPYTKLDIKPLIAKDKSGESFPSRHVLSVSLIASVCLNINIYIGIVMAVISVLIAVVRVMSGVHYIKDVVCGAVIGYGLGILLLCII